MPPTPLSTSDQALVDAEHLKVLAIVHFVLAGFGLFTALIIGGEAIFFRTAMQKVFETRGQMPIDMPTIMTVTFAVIAGLTLLRSIGNVISGFCLLKRRARMFSFVVAAFNCISIPFGAGLAVFTFIVLLRDSVKTLYAGAPIPPATV